MDFIVLKQHWYFQYTIGADKIVLKLYNPKQYTLIRIVMVNILPQILTSNCTL